MNILQAETPFGKSLLWELQEMAYKEFGPNAWAEKGVPFFATSNPYIAREFSRIIEAYLQNEAPQPNEPIYIFDLGAGSGKLGYLILQNLSHIPNLCYVMTDISDKNIKFWQTHSRLAPFISSGQLAFARFHHSGTPEFLPGNTVSHTKNPLILIASYFFDTIPQSLYQVENGKLLEGWVSLETEGEAKPDAAILEKIVCRYSYHHCKPANNELQDYASGFDQALFLYPDQAISVVERFAKISGDRLLLLAADQGVATREQVLLTKEPKMARHATFSFPVNYHALAHYFAARQGFVLPNICPDPDFITFYGVMGEKDSEYLKKIPSAFSPADWWRLGTGELFSQGDVEVLLLLLRIGEYDPATFYHALPKFLQSLATLGGEQKQELIVSVEQVWKNFYPVSPLEGDFVMDLGVLLFQMGQARKALFYFEQAIEIRGPTTQNLKNYSLCKSKI